MHRLERAPVVGWAPMKADWLAMLALLMHDVMRPLAGGLCATLPRFGEQDSKRGKGRHRIERDRLRIEAD